MYASISTLFKIFFKNLWPFFCSCVIFHIDERKGGHILVYTMFVSLRCCPIICSTLSSVTFKMASAAFSTKNDREMFTLASKFSDKLSAFPIRYRGFSPISIVGKHFLLSMMFKSTLWVARKIPMLLMVFCINRDALFRRDNLFPITFFAV